MSSILTFTSVVLLAGGALAGSSAEVEGLLHAEEAYREAIAAARAVDPAGALLARSLNELACLYNDLRRPRQAEPLLEEAVKLLRRGPSSSGVLATVINNLAESLRYQDRLAEAAALYREALAAADSEALRGVILENLANLHAARGQWPAAERLLRRAVAAHRQAPEAGRVTLGRTLGALGAALVRQGRPTEAMACYREAIAIGDDALGAEHPTNASLRNELALLYRHEGRFAQARALHEQALAGFIRSFGPRHALVGIAWNNLAMVYEGERRFAEAAELLRRSLSILDAGEEATPVVHANYERLRRRLPP